MFPTFFATVPKVIILFGTLILSCVFLIALMYFSGAFKKRTLFKPAPHNSTQHPLGDELVLGRVHKGLNSTVFHKENRVNSALYTLAKTPVGKQILGRQNFLRQKITEEGLNCVVQNGNHAGETALYVLLKNDDGVALLKNDPRLTRMLPSGLQVIKDTHIASMTECIMRLKNDDILGPMIRDVMGDMQVDAPEQNTQEPGQSNNPCISDQTQIGASSFFDQTNTHSSQEIVLNHNL